MLQAHDAGASGSASPTHNPRQPRRVGTSWWICPTRPLRNRWTSTAIYRFASMRVLNDAQL